MLESREEGRALAANSESVESRGPLAVTTLVSVIIPVFNEQKTILEILDRVRQCGFNVEILVVDDCSTDGTRETLRDQVENRVPGVRVYYHDKNRGKGAAIRTAIPEVLGEVVLIQDADLEYNPAEYPALLGPIFDGRADVVFGSRFIGGGAHRVHLFWHRQGNALLTLLSNMMTNLNLTDMEVCYKVFRREIIQRIRLRSNRFEFEPEVTAKVAKLHCRIYEVPVSYSGRDYSEGKKIGWRDGVSALWTIMKYRIID